MNLNSTDRNELREKISEKIRKDLRNIPKKIHLEKDLLESLLFETFTYNKSTNAKLKIPVWSGEFLQKIDLSEVSFEDVSWTLHSAYWLADRYKEYIDEDVFKKLCGLRVIEHNGYVDYGMTNAKIDFKKSFEFKTTGQISLFSCSFYGLDLSSNDMSSLYSVDQCDLSNTKLVLSPEMLEGKKHEDYVFSETDLSNVDLSKFTVDAIDIMDRRSSGFFDIECNLTNTNLNIVLDTTSESWKDLQNFENRPEGLGIEKITQQFMANVGGCYINGKKIPTDEEQHVLRAEKLNEYKGYKQQIIDSVFSSIDNQVSNMHK